MAFNCELMLLSTNVSTKYNFKQCTFGIFVIEKCLNLGYNVPCL